MHDRIIRKCVSVLILFVLRAIPVVPGVQINLIDNGYNDVTVAIDSSISEKSPITLIDAIKITLNETSRALFVATNNRAYFRNIDILIPATWKSILAEEEVHVSSYREVAFRVTPGNGKYGEDPFTLQPGKCGEPGEYIQLSQKFLTKSADDSGKILVREWAKYRWGVFDEHGYQGDSENPYFYTDSKGMVQPNYCTNSPLIGNIVYSKTNIECITNPFSGLPSDSCVFRPDESASSSVTTSLMALSDVPSIEKFCDSSTHDSKLRNQQNSKCDGRSIWDVMNEHRDFMLNNNPPILEAPNPEFRILRLSNPSYCLVIDDSSGMNEAYRSKRVKKAISTWVNYEVGKGSSIAIISYTGEAAVVHPLTEIVDEATKAVVVGALSLNSSGKARCIKCGLQKAVKVLEGIKNSVIILITTDSREAAPIEITDMEGTSSEIRVVTIALVDFGSNAENYYINSLTDADCKDCHFVPDDDIGPMFDNALRSSLSVLPSATQAVKIISETHTSLHNSKNTGTFIVDSTISKNLRVIIHVNDPDARSVFEKLNGPNGEPIGITVSKYLSVIGFSVPLAKEGVWTWEVQYESAMECPKISVEVFVEPADPSVAPIVAKNWVSETSENSSYPSLHLYTEVKQGDDPVMEAIAHVRLTSSNQTVILAKDLRDDGQNGDKRKNDGIYSATVSFNEFPYYGHYSSYFSVEGHSTTKIAKKRSQGDHRLVQKFIPNFRRSESAIFSLKSIFQRNLTRKALKRYKRQGLGNNLGLRTTTTPNITDTSTNTDSTTTTNTAPTTTNTASTTTNTAPTTTTNTEPTTTNTAPTTTTTTAPTTTNTASTTTNTAPTTTTNTESTTTNTAPTTTTNTAPTTTNTASTTTNTAPTTTNTDSTTTKTTASTSTITAPTTTNTASTTSTDPTNSITTTTNTAPTTTTTNTAPTTTNTASTTTNTVSTSITTAFLSSGASDTSATTAATGTITITSTGTGTTSSSTGTGSTLTSTGTGSTATSTGTGSTATSTGTGTTSISTGTGSTSTSTETVSTATSTGTGITAASTGTGTTSSSTGTGSTSTSTGTVSPVTSTGTGSTVTSTGTGSTLTSTGTGSTVTSTGTGSTLTSTGTGSTVTSTGTGSTVASTGTGSTLTSTGTGSTVTSTGTGSTLTSTGTGSTVTSTGTGSTITSTGASTSMLSSTSTSALAPATTAPITLTSLITDSDTIYPATINNVQATVISSNAVNITWTATGDDGKVGAATAYAILLHVNQSYVQCTTPKDCDSSSIILGYVSSVTTPGLMNQTAGTPLSYVHNSPSPFTSNVSYYVTVIPLDNSGNFGNVSNTAAFQYVAPPPFNYHEYFMAYVWPVLYQILQFSFSALYDICFAVIVGSTAGVFALAGLAIYFGSMREGDLELGLSAQNPTFPNDLSGLMNFKTSPQYYNPTPQRQRGPQASTDLADIRGIKQIRGATPDDILFVWSPIQGFDFDGNLLYKE